ncbi:helix-turn-helix domain-containing protein [Methylomonas fluvii]|uniref:Helix-turn-helix transcriptional regulator n=1 Tax=Methylomonas fluvii TaxID=1854564 RepID=A0ABR9DCN8_9GAMM|nr:helix-turn-helix transcriptional regulator [Methylomonas fluvii]MBD9359662.1 helix-turn-helix transcriptional regulator [Methylomonas fluvii]CAD6872407.1 hypothetical protein [Methylomonas fluvii]
MIEHALPQNSSLGLDGFPARLNQLIVQTALSQAEFARQIRISPGFLSDVIKGRKKPGTDFLYGIRSVFGASIDWLLTGEGTMFGRNDIDLDLLRNIELYIAVARSAVVDNDPTAKALLLLCQAGHIQEALADPALNDFLERIAPHSDLNLAAELYNSHLWYHDPAFRRRNLLASAQAHFEAQKPHDKRAAFANTPSAPIQINFGGSQRNSGRDYYEK